MFDSESWPFANLLTLSERIGPQAPLGMLHEVGPLAVKMQVSGQRRHQHVSGCTFDLVPPAGFEPARAAPENVAMHARDQRKHARRDLARARIGRSPPTLRSAGVGLAFRLTLHDRCPGFGEGHIAAFDIGGDLVAEVAVPCRAGPGDLRADPTAGRRPDLHDESARPR